MCEGGVIRAGTEEPGPGPGGALRMWAPAQRQLLTWSDIIS